MHRAKRAILWICSLALICGIWVTCYLQIRHDRRQAELAAEVNATNLNKAFEEHVLSTVQQIDAILLILRSDYLQHPGSFLEQSAIFKRTLPANLLIQINVINTRGMHVFHEVPQQNANAKANAGNGGRLRLRRAPDPIDLSDREHFRVQLDGAKDQLFISKPLLGRFSGKWSIQFTRKILRPDGGFGGVMVVSVAPAYFSSFFRSVDLGENGVISLVGTDHVIRARSLVAKYRPDANGQTLPADRPCFDLKRPAAGVYQLPSATDGIRRIWAYRRMVDYPLLVTVGLDLDEVLRPVAVRKGRLVFAGVCASLFLLLATGMILWLDRQQQRSEQSLLEAKQRLELATASARLGIWDWNIVTGALDWDARMFELYGRRPESFSGRVEEFQNALHPDDREATLEAVRRALTGEEESYFAQFRVILPDGSVKHIKGDGLVLRDAAGRGVRMIGLNRDITERKQMETALLESEEQFRTLCDAAPIGIFRSDDHGGTTYCNPRWEEITGFPASEGLGKGWMRTVHPDDLESFLQLAGDSIARGRILSHELRHVTPQGKIIWVRLLISPVYTPQGVLISNVGTLEDISEIRLARQELLKSQKLESLGVLAGGIAHDFNNILTAIFGNISLARYQLDDPEALGRRLEDAENAIVRATDLTKQLLTFSRGGAPVKKSIKLDDLLQEAAGFVLHGSSVTCRFEVAGDIWPVDADEGQLAQVIHNLMLNAVQAMPEGGTVTVGGENVCAAPDGARFVRIRVADTGSGIAEGNLTRIFDPYFTTKPQGNGLGLATCYSIVKKHGGKLRAYSREGEGSTFVISLPASEEPCLTDPKSQQTLFRGSGRVLVMDDDANVRTIAGGILAELGYTAEFAGHGAEAVELYRQRREQGTPFLAAILDLTIPGGIGGKETIARLQEIDPGVKAVVSSGYSNDPVMANFRDYGFRAVLSKPYRPQELSQVLWELTHPP